MRKIFINKKAYIIVMLIINYSFGRIKDEIFQWHPLLIGLMTLSYCALNYILIMYIVDSMIRLLRKNGNKSSPSKN